MSRLTVFGSCLSREESEIPSLPIIHGQPFLDFRIFNIFIAGGSTFTNPFSNCGQMGRDGLSSTLFLQLPLKRESCTLLDTGEIVTSIVSWERLKRVWSKRDDLYLVCFVRVLSANFVRTRKRFYLMNDLTRIFNPVRLLFLYLSLFKILFLKYIRCRFTIRLIWGFCEIL